MTLAAALLLEDYPFVFADLLITFEEGEEASSLTLPAVGLVSALPQQRRRIEGMRQKLSVISDTVVVAYAGDVRKALFAIRALRHIAARGPLSFVDVQRLVEQKGVLLHGVAIVGLILDTQAGAIHSFHVNGEQVDGGYLGRVLAAGSGVPLLVANCDRVHSGGFDGIPPGARALYKLLSLCGLLVRDEHATGLPVLEMATGGAYEIAYLRQGRFQKAEVTFVVWHINVFGTAIQIGEPFLILKTRYVEDFLLCNTARNTPTKSKEGATWCWHVNAYFVPPPFPFDGTFIAPSSREIGFHSSITQHSFLVMRDKEGQTFSIVEYGGCKLDPRLEGDQFVISYDEEFDRRIRQQVESMLPGGWEPMRD